MPRPVNVRRMPKLLISNSPHTRQVEKFEGQGLTGVRERDDRLRLPGAGRALTISPLHNRVQLEGRFPVFPERSA